MKRFNKIYIEISNVCNLDCAFCIGTTRHPRIMSHEEFESILEKVKPYTDYIYFHLMGEPLMHPRLEQFFMIAKKHGLKVIITTNGTLLREQLPMLREADALHKVNVSLHSFEANDLWIPFEEYVKRCIEFGKALEGEKIIVYRLWNSGGADKRNGEIVDALKSAFSEPWVEERHGIRIGERVYIEHGEKFDWPSLGVQSLGNEVFCMGLRDQIGILADGTVVPCCLDHDGDIPLGNIFKSDLGDIINSPRALAMQSGFEHKKASEELCRRCGYAHSKFKI